jgi:hypothetical protein
MYHVRPSREKGRERKIERASKAQRLSEGSVSDLKEEEKNTFNEDPLLNQIKCYCSHTHI